MNIRIATLIITLFTSAASATPFLKSKTNFLATDFCKTHTCKLTAIIPSGILDQYIYSVNNNWNVTVWKVTNDKKRLEDSYAGKYTGINNGVSMVWYGVQDTPFGSQKIFSDLVGMATGKPVSSETALRWLDDGGNKGVDWGSFRITPYYGSLPNTNSAIFTMQIDFFQP